MHVVFFAWMDGDFRRRQSENEPSVAHICIRQLKDILQESPIRLGVLAVNDRVSANNHRYFAGAGVANGLPFSTMYVANMRAGFEPELVAL